MIPLPTHAYHPGRGDPDRAPLDAAKRLVRRPTTAEGWEADRSYRYGARLCAGGFYWEAHEVWEAVWWACAPNGRERRLLRALIQLANAALKIEMGRPRAARRLMDEAHGLIAELAGATPALMGLPLWALADALADAERFAATSALADLLGSALAPVADALDNEV